MSALADIVIGVVAHLFDDAGSVFVAGPHLAAVFTFAALALAATRPQMWESWHHQNQQHEGAR